MQHVINCPTPQTEIFLEAKNLQEHLRQWVPPRTRRQSPSNQSSPTQLPLWAETVRCLPSEIVRSALFNARNRNQPRAKFKDAEIAVIGEGRIIIDEGFELRQDDESIVC